MTEQIEPVRPSQATIFAAPTFFVDDHLGIAAGRGVARVTFTTYKLNADPDATQPLLHPEVTIAIPELSLLVFAHQVIDRATLLGITLEDEV